MMFTKAWLTETLRFLQQQVGEQVEPHLIMSRRDWRWRGTDVVPCDAGGLPSLVPGSHGCCRVSTDDGEDGLHLAFEKEIVEIHLDRIDARRRPVEHGLDATSVAMGAGLGLFVGFVLAAATGKPLAALGGVAVGAAIGATTARRANRFYRVLVDGRLGLLQATTRRQATDLMLATTT